uniref:Uncharacterized protein n=1 Tax=Schistosoma haematobium TaxID=6185 RepID=A0A095BVW6_SCHHA
MELNMTTPKMYTDMNIGNQAMNNNNNTNVTSLLVRERLKNCVLNKRKSKEQAIHSNETILLNMDRSGVNILDGSNSPISRINQTSGCGNPLLERTASSPVVNMAPTIRSETVPSVLETFVINHKTSQCPFSDE